MSQNMFLKDKGFRTMSLNSHYFIIFKNPRANDQVSCLARQIYPNNVKFFKEAYGDATATPHSYILLDLTQSCPEKLRFRTNVLPSDKDCTTIYVPIESKSNKT